MAAVLWIFLELSCTRVSVPPEAKSLSVLQSGRQGDVKSQVSRLLPWREHIAQGEPLGKWHVLADRVVASCFGACW